MSHPVKASRLLQRLDAEIAAAPTPLASDCKRAERAGYLARSKRFDEFDSELEILRHRHADSPSIEIAIWLNLIEGMSIFSRSLDMRAREKLHRAYVLSVRLGRPDLRALCGAWMAYAEYIKQDFASMAMFADDTLKYSDKEHHSALARIHLVLAAAYHYAGAHDLAAQCYKSAREHSTISGDDSMLSAILHKRAWGYAQGMRLREWVSQDVVGDDERALLHAESTTNFDLFFGIRSVDNSVPMLRAFILSAQGRYEEAAAIYDEHLDAAVAGELSIWRLELLIDAAWCALKIGAAKAWTESFISSALRDPKLLSNAPDQRLLVYSRIHQIQIAMGKIEDCERIRGLAEGAVLDHRLIQKAVLDALSSKALSLVD